ncbi:ribonuclease III [Euzebya tangerina]|uniref:ribonuclease III n=1 Tax=Euzebya tangerina TaxID=591198 RepID=UPI00196ADFD9|nr:ribonuclease III [Euzebya tangerina]
MSDAQSVMYSRGDDARDDREPAGDTSPPTATRTAEEAALEDVLGVVFDDVELLRQALTHRSYAFEAGGIGDNERLEFLGDAVLGLVVTDEIYTTLPESAEGRLAKVRAAAVNTISLAEVARDIGIGDAVRLGVGEQQSGGRTKDSILANTMEAILGAVYLDDGIETAREVVLRLFRPMLEDIVTRRESLDYKTSLQELTAAELNQMPSYHLTDTGPDHAKEFTAHVVINGESLGSGIGRSKKEAEQGAAREAFRLLRQRHGTGASAPATPPSAPTESAKDRP